MRTDQVVTLATSVKSLLAFFCPENHFPPFLTWAVEWIVDINPELWLLPWPHKCGHRRDTFSNHFLHCLGINTGEFKKKKKKSMIPLPFCKLLIVPDPCWSWGMLTVIGAITICHFWCVHILWWCFKIRPSGLRFISCRTSFSHWHYGSKKGAFGYITLNK